MNLCLIREIGGLFFGYSPLVCTRLFVEAGNSGEESSPQITLIYANKKRSAFIAAAALSDTSLHSRSFALLAGNSELIPLSPPPRGVCPVASWKGRCYTMLHNVTQISEICAICGKFRSRKNTKRGLSSVAPELFDESIAFVIVLIARNDDIVAASCITEIARPVA